MKQPLHNKQILVITNMYPSEKHQSFGVFIKNQVNSLKQRGFQVDLAAITNPNSGKMNVITKYAVWILRTVFLLLAKGRTYQIVHAHYTFPSGYLALLFKRFFHTRMIVTAHGGDIDKMAKKSARLFQLTNKVLQEADHVIAVGEELRQRIISDFSIDPQKVSLINMGVNREIFNPQPKNDIREQLRISKDQKLILFVGNLLEQKGLLELMDAFEIIQQWDRKMTLTLIGAEKDVVFKKKLEQIVQERKQQGSVHFIGAMEQREIARWMAAADCLVLPSHMEGFGLVALEAMACGTPVVGTNVGGLKYLLGNEAGIITPMKNSKELANSLYYVLSSESEREKLLKNGMKKAEENDQERMLDRVIEVYFPTGG
jgi:glycosyltransferase involved in cell wall biosynthesis